ncbi:MAG: hypothetical protein WDO56_03345 [Gammaproteobacteria bacterium]
MSTPLSPSPRDAALGARNLLRNCAGVKSGDSVLLIVEPEGSRHYEPALVAYIAACARELGAHVELLEVAPTAGPEHAPAAMMQAIEAAAHTIFLNRIGDQLRFGPLPGRGSKTMCYALDLDFLGSDFAVSPYEVWESVHDRLLSQLDAADSYSIRCPLGTDLSMKIEGAYNARKRTAGFTVKTFPVMIVPPFPASGLSGRLVLSQALTSTYVHPYDSSVMPLPSPLTLFLENGIIVRMDGDADLVARAKAQFDRVASLFGGPQWAVNSWHAGINAFTFFPRPALSDIDRWSSVAFGSPRYAHFHMCGSAPGDICGQIFDPTITFDGEPLWEDGRAAFLTTAEKQRLVAQTGDSLQAFAAKRDLGIEPPAAPRPG